MIQLFGIKPFFKRNTRLRFINKDIKPNFSVMQELALFKEN